MTGRTSSGGGKAGPRRAMVLAAGLGERLRPLTQCLPKPLIEVGGKPLIDHVLDRLREVGIETVVVNTHYKADLLESHLAERRQPAIRVSHEDELMDTGGGVAKALEMLGPDPFLVVNGDILWLNGPSDTLGRIAEGWDDGRMDAYLLLYPSYRADGYDGLGDFFLEPGGRGRCRRDGEVVPYVFTGVQMLHPRLFAERPSGPFPLTRLYERAERRGRLFGLVHDGVWVHVGTPYGLAAAQRLFSGGIT